MPFYTGNTADGSDMREVEGMYISPNGKEFSNMPYAPSREDRLYARCREHCAANMRTWRDEYELIKQKKSTMSSACRAYLLTEFEKFLNEPTPE